MLVRSHKQAPYRYISLSLLQLTQNSFFFLFLFLPFRFCGLGLFSYVPTKMIPLQKGWFVVFPIPVNIGHIHFMTLFFSLVIPLRSIPHTTTEFFKTSASSSHIPWTSTILTYTVSINFEQSHLISLICT